jgi:hypothetical protein
MFELLSQSWFEPGTDNAFDVGDMAIILGFAVSVVASATGLSRWWLKQLRKTIHDEIEEYTKPIQPTANGGLSLPDVARKVEKMEFSVNRLIEDNGKIEKSIESLKNENRDTWGLMIKHLSNIKED